MTETFISRGFVHLIGEAGYEPAIYSLSKPYSKSANGTFEDFIHNSELLLKMDKVADKLAWRNNGENKFLRMMNVYLDILAPRHWWAHFDTYKVGVVAQSNSIGNKISSKEGTITLENCEYGTTQDAVTNYNNILVSYKFGIMRPTYMTLENTLSVKISKYDVKSNLPEGFLQSRVVATNYASLQTMWYQRHEQERHPFWKVFFEMYDHLDHVGWAKKVEDTDEMSKMQ
jgi:hypothetical protein